MVNIKRFFSTKTKQPHSDKECRSSKSKEQVLDKELGEGEQQDDTMACGLLQPLNFDEAIKDSPAFRHQLGGHEKYFTKTQKNFEETIRYVETVGELGQNYISAFYNLTVSLNNLWTDLQIRDESANEAYTALSDAFAQVVHLQKSVIEGSYPILRGALESFVKKELHHVNDSRHRFEQMSSEFDEGLSKKAAINKNKTRDLIEAKNHLMAVGTLFAHTSLDYVANIEQAHAKKCFVILEALSTFISDYSTFFQKGHKFFENTSEINMDKINEAISSMKVKSKVVERKMQERHSVVPKEVYQHPTGIPTDQTVVMEGYLMKRATNAFKTWNRRWFQIKDDKLLYSHKNGDPKPTIMEENLQLCLVRQAPATIERACCFELVTPSKNHLLQADSDALCTAWILALRRTIQDLHENGQAYRPQRQSLMQSINEACARTPSITTSNGRMPSISSSMTMPNIRTGTPSISASNAPASSPSPRSRHEQAQAKMKKRLELNFSKLVTLPGNEKCADCGALDPRWASINLGILVCTECCGCHRSLGVHISKMRSLTMDEIEDSQWQILLKLGNAKVNSIYLSNLPENNVVPCRPTASSARPIREAWIQAKYVDKRFSKSERKASNGLLKNQIRSSASEVFRQPSLSECSTSSTTAHTNGEISDTTQNSARSDSGLSVDGACKRFSRSSFGSENNLDIMEHIANATEIERIALEAVKHGDLSEMLRAILAGLDINIAIGNSYLVHYAVKAHDNAMIEFLFLNGAKACVVDIDGNTPLHIAALKGYPIIVYQLIKRNTDSSIKNKNNKTAVEIAVEAQHADIVTLLRLYEMGNEECTYDMEQTLENFIDELCDKREKELSELKQ